MSNTSRKPRTNWKGWLGVALFIAFIIGVNVEKYSEKGQAQSAAAWRGATQQIGEEVCDADEWSKTPGRCEELAAGARERAARKFQNYQK